MRCGLDIEVQLCKHEACFPAYFGHCGGVDEHAEMIA